MAGMQTSQNTLDQTLGQAVVALARDLRNVNALNSMLLDTDRYGGASGLIAKGIYTQQSDANLVIASFADLAALYQVAHAQRQQVGNNDFFFNAKLLMGTEPLL